jgi:squalene/oxidosqualene cyclase-like protein
VTPSSSALSAPRRGHAEAAYGRALDHLRGVQRPDGALAGEVIWNPMLICQYVIAAHILGEPIDPARRRRIHQSLALQVRPDGGWAMHAESGTFLFHTVLGYVALRLLGHPPEDPLVAGALRWIRANGGVVPIPTWGRVWLAMLGLYPWQCVQPILPELWLLPESAPFHPRRLYCHMRLIYLGLSYLYGVRLTAPPSPILDQLRAELYPDGYDRAPFVRERATIAATDLFEAPGPALQAAFAGLRAAERLSPARLRRRALDHAFEQILFELRSTAYVCLSPVNGLLFTLALHARDPAHHERAAAFKGVEYWVWEDDQQGLRIAGARSDIWDTSFALQAICEGPADPQGDAIVQAAAPWLARAQLAADIPGGARHHRSPARGGWGFADERHPWPVSDCTAEALEALLRAQDRGLAPPSVFSASKQHDAIRFIISRQNDDGGFGSYEARRGSMVLRHFNPAEIYGNCMLEYSYTECTASCVRGLAYARARPAELPAPLRAELDRSIERGVGFLLRGQHPSGGWLGFWGVNLTYGTFFATTALRACGLPHEHPALRRARRWLCGAQRPDGGWGESYRGVLRGEEEHLPPGTPSLVVQTAWAILALRAAAPADDPAAAAAIDRGVAYLCERQGEDGAWPREAASGVFFNTAVLDYDLYRQVFPTWALASYLSLT